LRRGQVGITGEQLQWIITVSNPSDTAGQNVTIDDTIDERLQINRVEAHNAQVIISDQKITVTYAVLNPDETVQFSIFTTVLNGIEVKNMACINASNQAMEECTVGFSISQLPETGASLWSNLRIWLCVTSLLIFLAGIYAFIGKRR
jgi:uncharacterized repeat protein (TIGR01451 family)